MDDYVRYEEFFRDDEESEDREDDDETEERSYSQRKAIENQTPQKPARREEKADSGCLVLVLIGMIWIIYIVIKLAGG